MIKKLGVWLCLGLTLGCASLQPARPLTENDILAFLEALSRGPAGLQELELDSPFLLDSELIVASQDSEHFWQDYTAAGFRLEAPVIELSRPVEPPDCQLFGDSWELKVFFRHYIPPTAWLVSVVEENRRYRFIITSRTGKPPLFHAFKGPAL